MDSHVDLLISRLRRDANDLQAYTELKNYYRQHRDYISLLNLVEGWAGQCKDQKAASNAYYEAAEISLQKIDEPDRAKSLLQNALHSNPFNTKASESLESLLNEFGEFHELAGLLDHQIRTLESSRFDPTYIALLEYRLAALWNNQFHHSKLALDHYYRAIQFDPSLLIAIYEAREICLNNRELEKAADLNQMEADAESNPTRKAALFRELATLYSTDLNDPDNAVNALLAAAKAAPDNVENIRDLANCLARRAESKDPEQAAADYQYAAQLFCQLALGAPDASATQYLERALEYAPANENVLSQLEALADKMGKRHLLPPYWIEYIANAEDGPLVNKRRVSLARVYLESGQEDEAVFCLQQAIDHGDSEAIELLNKFYAKTGRTPVGLDIDALTRSAKSDRPVLEDVTRNGPLPDRETAAADSELDGLLAESQPEQLEIDDIEELDLEPDADDRPPSNLDIDFDRLAQAETDGETETNLAVSPAEDLPEEAHGPVDAPRSASSPSSVAKLKERLKRKRDSQRAPNLVDSTASQSESKLEQNLFRPVNASESLSTLVTKGEKHGGLDRPILSIRTPIPKSANGSSPSQPLELEQKEPQSTLPPPFRRNRVERSEQATPEEQVTPPSHAPLESPGSSQISSLSEVSSVQEQEAEYEEPIGDAEQQVDVLSKKMQQAIAARRKDEAERIAEQIVTIVPANLQAYSFLEIAFRRKQKYDKLRTLLIRSTEDPELESMRQANYSPLALEAARGVRP